MYFREKLDSLKSSIKIAIKLDIKYFEFAIEIYYRNINSKIEPYYR